MKKCPYCAEEVQDDALICKHCKKELNKYEGNSPYGVSKSDFTKYLIITILIPLAGIIMGIYFITKPNPKIKKMGERLIIWGIGLAILESALWYAYIGGVAMDIFI